MKKERLVFRSKGLLQETTSAIGLAAQFSKRSKVDGGQSYCQVHCIWSSMRALTGGMINILNGFFQRKERRSITCGACKVSSVTSENIERGGGGGKDSL